MCGAFNLLDLLNGDALSRRTDFPIALILTTALFLGGAGTAATFLELRPLLGTNQNPATEFAQLAEAPPSAGLSIQAQQAALLKCYGTMTSFFALAQPFARREPVIRNCLTLAGALSSWNPSFSLAFFVGAFASFQLGDQNDLVDRLRESQRVGASELWIAELRVDLAERARERFGPAGLEFENEDLALLAMSNRGVKSIAYRYVSDPDFRERITQIVEQMPAAEQRRFLRAVASVAGSIGR